MKVPSVLGIIPARGGSKGVIRKNIRLVAGEPLIRYTIDAALNCSSLSRIVTSTDDAEIAAVAERFRSEVMIRPPDLAADDTPMVPVIRHVLSELKNKGDRFDQVVLLQPTTPFRTAADIDNVVRLLQDSDVKSVVSVYRAEDHHPSRMYTLANGLLVPYEREPDGSLRQDLPDVYHRNGAVYASWVSVIEEQSRILDSRILPYVMPKERSVNIDDEFDLKIADLIIKEREKCLRF